MLVSLLFTLNIFETFFFLRSLNLSMCFKVQSIYFLPLPNFSHKELHLNVAAKYEILGIKFFVFNVKWINWS